MLLLGGQFYSIVCNQSHVRRAKQLLILAQKMGSIPPLAAAISTSVPENYNDQNALCSMHIHYLCWLLSVTLSTGRLWGEASPCHPSGALPFGQCLGHMPCTPTSHYATGSQPFLYSGLAQERDGVHGAGCLPPRLSLLPCFNPACDCWQEKPLSWADRQGPELGAHAMTQQLTLHNHGWEPLHYGTGSMYIALSSTQIGDSQSLLHLQVSCHLYNPLRA